MYINTESNTFVPKEFIVLNFYEIDTCFAWNENEFVCFPYLHNNNSTAVLQILKAPTKIKDIRGFDKRIFILCYPKGIYKLTDTYEFACLSEAGIELGSNFYEVFTIGNDLTLILKDKKSKSTKKLCTLNPNCDIQVLSLDSENTDKSLYEIFLPSERKSIDNLCLFACDKKLFKICEQNIQIIYNCDYSVKGIKPVEKNQKVIGIILQTDIDIAVLIHVVDKKLKYEKIHLQTSVQRLCAVVDVDNDNLLLLIYSDGIKIYYATKLLNKDSIQEVRSEEQTYESFRLYQSKFIIFLNSFKELKEVNIEKLRNTNNGGIDDFVKLKPSMLQGIEGTLEIISHKTTELKELKQEMIRREDILKRINLFSTKNYLKFSPKDTVIRMYNQVFLVSNFKKALPKNSVMVKMLKCREKTVFSMKTVKDEDTVIEMPVLLTNLSSGLYTTTDLITHRIEGGVWCLIKNYIRDPLPSEGNQIYLTSDKRKLIKYKLLVLQNMIKENRVNMEELSRIKREVREGLKDLFS